VSTAADFAVDLAHEFGDRVGSEQLGEAPDQEILAAPGAHGFAAPAPAFGVLDQVGPPLPVAPARAGGLGQAFQRGLVGG
jgi:hypothetical protein